MTGCEIMKCKHFSGTAMNCMHEGDACIYSLGPQTKNSLLEHNHKKERTMEQQGRDKMYVSGPKCGPPQTEAKRGAVLDALENAERAASRLTEEIGTLRDRMECVLSDCPNKTAGIAGQQVPTNPNKSPLSERIDGHTYVLEALCYQVNNLRQRLEV